ncbi:MAG: hypothetical protein HC849_20390 [Oscillatoriales cyanobacterium RU_3_3]|nr:hypothetical protein [Microcoleus sp. SU_5_6]NJL67800.1 hypothetical protein [Microcoleus sp. SM1_3_4]NJM62025.1 hypothetical protein [Oscillatoriales cyanobacterium RU_3_3]
MSATTINHSEIRPIFQPRTFSASKFWELAQKANNLTVIIESRWEKIPDKTQELLKFFAYNFIDPSQGIKQRLLEYLGILYLAIVLAWLTVQGKIDCFLSYKNALNKLVNAILREVEREDEAYQQTLSEAIEEAFTDWQNTKSMSAEEACQRIKEISYQAVSEL